MAATSPPTRRVIDVLDCLADCEEGATSSQLAQRCGISTSTCALVLAELERRTYVVRSDDRRYSLSSGLFGIVRRLRAHYPLLDVGRHALEELSLATGSACSLSKIDSRGLTIVDFAGHKTDEQYAVGQVFPIDPPFGLVAMAWRDPESIDAWLHRVTPPPSHDEIEQQRQVLSDIRNRGYGAWRFDRSHLSLRDRLNAILDSTDGGSQAASMSRQLSKILTLVSLQSVTDTLDQGLDEAEFVVAPIFGADGQPGYQIEIRLERPAEIRLTTAQLEFALDAAAQRLSAVMFAADRLTDTGGGSSSFR